MDKLYHYTNASSLIGIVSNNCFWASNILQMNDSAEYKYSGKIISNFLRIKAKEIKGRGADFLDEYAEIFLDNFNYLDNKGWSNEPIYSFSLSEKPDRLSQWRGYTPHDGGYCVGIYKSKLEEISNSNGYKLEKCIYNEQDQLTRISDILSPVLNSYDWDKVHGTEKYTRLAHIFRKSQPIRAIIKDPSFFEEAEWRIYGNRPNINTKLHFRNKGSYVIPYRILNFDPEKLISEIYLSPDLDHERAASSIRMLLGSNRIGDCKIHPSSCTLR